MQCPAPMALPSAITEAEQSSRASHRYNTRLGNRSFAISHIYQWEAPLFWLALQVGVLQNGMPAHKAITERGGKDCKSELKISVEGKSQNWNFKIKISY